MKWTKDKEYNEWHLNCHPFTFSIFLGSSYADCVVCFGLETEMQTVKGKDGTSNLDAGKEWCLDWARQKLAELNNDFSTIHNDDG